MKSVACPFCLSKSTSTFGQISCGVCGIKTDPVVAFRMAHMTPKTRANFIGYYHAANSWAYGWQLPTLSRGEVRAYAKGYLSVPINTGDQRQNLFLFGDQARRDASWFRV